MSDHEPKGPAPIGQEAPKSPAERNRLIQEMQRAAEAQAARNTTPAAQVAEMEAAGVAPGSRIPDGYRVEQLNAVAKALKPQPTPAELNAYAKAQASTQSLFGTSDDLEVTGNPWKVIPFGDVLPGLFDTEKPLSNYEAVLPEKAVKTPQGLLFEVGLKEKDGTGPVQKRAVLVDAQGKLAGAECKTPQQAQKLLTSAPWLLPASAARAGAGWTVAAGRDSAFALQVSRTSGSGRTTEAVALNNFARVADSRGRALDLVVANYYLDKFEASVG